MTRMNRCDRFKKEFNRIACSQYGLDNPKLISQSLGMLDMQELVYMFYLLDQKAGEVEVMLPLIFFDPEEPDEDVITRVMDLFKFSKKEAVRRLKKAELIDA